VLLNESGLKETVGDSGSISNFGLTLRFMREIPLDILKRYGIFKTVDEDTIRNLVIEQANMIYKAEFWDDNNFEQIESQHLCNYVFDMGVAHGIGTAIQMLQRAIWAEAFERGYIKQDGILGPETITAVNSVGNGLLPLLVGIRSEFYINLAANKKNKSNLEAWLHRCYDVFK
jgi:lysozyme family protein